MTLPGMPAMPPLPPSVLPPGQAPFGSALPTPKQGSSDNGPVKPMPVGLNGMLPPTQPALFTTPSGSTPANLPGSTK